MFIEDRTYSAEEISGGRDIEDRTYTSDEVNSINDLFSEYYELNIDHYGDDSEQAYNDFYDAYSSSPTLVKVESKKEAGESSKPTFKIGHNTTRGLATGVGAGAGYLVSRAINKKDNAKKKELTLKVNRGQASKSDILELHAINKRIRKTAVAGTLAGAGIALGGTVLASKLSKKDSNNSSEDAYSYAKDLAKSHTGRTLIGAGLGAVTAQGITSFGAEATMRRQLKAKLKDKSISINERAQLRDLLSSRDKAKMTGAKLGAFAGFFSPEFKNNPSVKYHPYEEVK